MNGDDQIIFVDTPGLHQTEKLLNQYMLEEALKAMGDCDVILFLAPVTDQISHYEDFLEKNKKNTKLVQLRCACANTTWGPLPLGLTSQTPYRLSK